MFVKCCRRILAEPSFALYRMQSCNTFSSTAVLSKKYEKSQRKPRNTEIEERFVQLVDPETHKLRELAPLAEILHSIDDKKYYVELVQKDPPIARLVDRKEAHAARKALKAKLKVSKMEQKEVQMTWNVGDTDLAHKLKKAREQLEKGNMVDIAFAPKSRQPVPSAPEMRAKMQYVVDTLQDLAVEKQERTLERGVGVVYLRVDKASRQDSLDKSKTGGPESQHSI